MKDLVNGILNVLGGSIGLIFYILDESNKINNKDLMLYINILIVLFLLMLNVYRLSKVNDKPAFKNIYVLLISALIVTIVGYTIMHITTVFPSVNIVGGALMIMYTIRNNHCKKRPNKV